MTLLIQNSGRQDIQKFNLTKRHKETLWKQFLGAGVTTTKEAAHLPYLMNRCEKSRIPYILKAMPGIGYHIQFDRAAAVCALENKA